MSILIFNKNSDNLVGSLYKMAPNQSYYDTHKKWSDDTYDLVVIDEDDYNKIKLNTKQVVSKNGTSVTYTDNPSIYNSSEQLKKDIQLISDCLKEWMSNNTNESLLISEVNTYHNYLNSIDVNTITYPLNLSIESYVNNQGISIIHPLELF
jgi:hypothetical protein